MSWLLELLAHSLHVASYFSGRALALFLGLAVVAALVIVAMWVA